MGFPNVDIFLVKTIIEKFQALQAAPAFTIYDLFEDLSQPERDEITAYITRKTFTDDLREREDSQVFIFPHFPMLNMPLPQIGVSLGQEETSDKFFGDTVGEAVAVKDINDVVTHWDIPKAYIASANYQADIVCATKDEAIWLSRFVQRFICEELDALDQIGVKQVDIGLADMVLKQDQQPMTVFNRAVRLSCKVENTWLKRIPVQTYDSGINLALSTQTFTSP